MKRDFEITLFLEAFDAWLESIDESMVDSQEYIEMIKAREKVNHAP